MFLEFITDIPFWFTLERSGYEDRQNMTFGPERQVNDFRSSVNEPKVVSKFSMKVLVCQTDQESLK